MARNAIAISILLACSAAGAVGQIVVSGNAGTNNGGAGDSPSMTSSGTISGAVSALAALFGGGGSSPSSGSSNSGNSGGGSNTRQQASTSSGSRQQGTFQSNTQDCVRQAINLQSGACSTAANQVTQGNAQAASILKDSCANLVEVWSAQENLPSHSCCADLIQFIEDGCTCNQQVTSLAQNVAGVMPATIRATTRKAQISCGRGQIYDPCTGDYGC